MPNCAKVGRIEFAQAFDTGICLVESSEQAQCPAEARPGGLGVWREAERSAIRRRRLLAVMQMHQHITAPAVKCRIVGLQSNRAIMAMQSLCNQSEPGQLLGEMEVGFCSIGLAANDIAPR